MFMWMRWPQTSVQAVTALIVTAAAVFALAVVLMFKAPMRVPVAALSLLTAGVIVVDQWLGAPASFTNFFGYSPLLAARFYGMGNEAAAILVGSCLLRCCSIALSRGGLGSANFRYPLLFSS
jgi:hypothetical protein